jgi:hypothetical protein
MADTFWSADFWPAGFWADGFWTNQGAPEPEPETDTAQTPAGKSRRHRRYVVEIDGQQFAVDSASQAVELLQRARAIAERQAEQQAEQKSQQAAKALTKKARVPRVRIAAPAIHVSPDIQADAAPLIADIERLYRQAEETAELRLLLLKQMADEDDEDDVLLLL